MKHGTTLLLAALLLTGCNSLRHKESLLSAAGFRTVIPSTPAQIAHLKSLRQGTITPIVRNGQNLFFLADAGQNRLFIGDQRQYRVYQQLRLKGMDAGETLAAASLNADATDAWDTWGWLDTPYWGPKFNQ
jgi:hypothetical protein